VVFVKKWMKTRHATLFRLSNKLMQFQFRDKTQIIFDGTNKGVLYITKTNEIFKSELKDALNSEDEGYLKRLKYAKSLL